MPLPKNPKAQAFEHSNAEKFGHADHPEHPAHPDHPDHPVHPVHPEPPPPPPPEINIIRDDPTTDTILHGTVGADIFVFDASATYSSTQSPFYGSMITDSIVGFDPTQDQIALVNFDTRYLSSSPPGVQFGISLDKAPGDYATYDSYLTLSRPGLHHEIHAIDMTPFPVDDVHIYANDPYAGVSSVPVPPPPPPEPNIIRDDPSAYNVLHATAGADVFVFEADKYTGVTTSDYIIGFDPAHDQIALVNIPSWDNFWFGNSLVADSRVDGENAPGTGDGYMAFQTQGGWTHTVWTIDSNTFDPGALHLYHGDPFVIII
jgi:hypothetical protein